MIYRVMETGYQGPTRLSRKGFVLVGVIALFAILAMLVFILARIEANSRRRVQIWELQERLDRLAFSAAEVAKSRLLSKGAPDKGFLESGMDDIKASWTIEIDPKSDRGGFVLKGFARTPIEGVIKFQSQKELRFGRKDEKDKVTLVPAK